MKQKPRISVVMPVYNGEQYLDEAIQSVLNQTYENFEFIIINDGSKDKTLEIIKKYAEKDKRIVIISRENKGLIASLNEGIEKANGEYIARMDADDICLPYRFEKQLDYMIKQKLDLCGSWVQPFDRYNLYNIWKYPEKHQTIIFRLFFASSFAHPSVMIKKEVFKILNYKNQVAEDYKLWCDIIVNGYKVGNIQKVLLKYRLHDKQITQMKIEELNNSVNNIKLEFVKKIDNNLYDVVKKSIYLQNNGNISIFKEVINKTLLFSKLYSVDQKNIKYILSTIYNNTMPKNIFIYLIYLKSIKEYKINIKDEFIFFIKSFMFFKKNSIFYKVLFHSRKYSKKFLYSKKVIK